MNTRKWYIGIALFVALGIGFAIGIPVGAAVSNDEPVAVSETTTTNSEPKTDTPVTQSPSPKPTRTPKPSPTPTGPATFILGESATVTLSGDPAGTIIVESIDTSTEAPDQYRDAPTNGVYLTVSVSASALETDDFSVNPFEFYIRDDAGNRWDQTAGNAFHAVTDNDLGHTDLNAGETVRGTITFDVPATATEIVYAPANRALGVWTIDLTSA